VSDAVEVVRLTLYYVLHLSAWFALAIFITAMVDLLYLDIVAKRSLRRNKGWVGVVSAACVGAFSPFCSFIVIPLIRKLLRGGIPLSAVMAFWVASPTMDPEIYAMSAAQLGVPLATARLVGAVVLSVGAGFIVLFMERRGMFTDVLRDDEDDRPRPLVVHNKQPELVATTASGAGIQAPVAAPTQSAASAEPADPDDEDMAWWPTAKASLRSARNWRITFRNIGRDVIGLGKWLLLACFLEALVVMYVPTELIARMFGEDIPLVSIPLAALVGVPLYLNGAGAIPVVDGLLIKGMAAGAAVTFLLGGAVTTIPAMVAVRSIVRNSVFLLYLGVGVVGSILIGFVAQIVL
jgi:uncharacterized protein